jgi:hypothetical protein
VSTTPFKDLIAAAAEAKYTVIPANDYPVRVRDANATKSSTGKDMIKLAVKVIGGPHADASILTQQTLSPENPAAVAIFLKFLNAFGITEDWLAELPPRDDGGPNIAAVAAALKGRVAIAVVDVHQWNDEDRNGIDKFKKPTAEQEAAIREALGDAAPQAFGSPQAGPSDPFAAAAPAGGKPAGEPF